MFPALCLCWSSDLCSRSSQALNLGLVKSTIPARSDADLLLRLTLQILVGTEGKRCAEQDDGVEADARGGAVRG